MTDCVYASVLSMKAPVPLPYLHRVLVQPAGPELLSREHTLLIRRPPRNRQIAASYEFLALSPINSYVGAAGVGATLGRMASHAERVAARVWRNKARLRQACAGTRA